MRGFWILKSLVTASAGSASVVNNAGVHFAGRIPSDAVFLLEDFFLSLPDEMAGAEVLVFASRDFLMGAFCGRFDDRADVRIISDRVVEKADFRVGVFIGLPRKLATAKELGIGGRRRWWWRHLCPEGCLSEGFLALSALASTLEGQQQNPKGNPNRACERDNRTGGDFDKQVLVR